MDLFEKNYNSIWKIAQKVASRYQNFYTEELVSAFYIKYRHYLEVKAPWLKKIEEEPWVLYRRIKLDMLNYVQIETEFKYRRRWERDGIVRPEFFSFDDEVFQNHGDTTFLESLYDLYDFEKDYDNKELVEYILSNSELTDIEYQILRKYYIDGKILLAIAHEVGKSESGVSYIKNKAINKVKESFQDIYDESYLE